MRMWLSSSSAAVADAAAIERRSDIDSRSEIVDMFFLIVMGLIVLK